MLGRVISVLDESKPRGNVCFSRRGLFLFFLPFFLNLFVPSFFSFKYDNY